MAGHKRRRKLKAGLKQGVDRTKALNAGTLSRAAGFRESFKEQWFGLTATLLVSALAMLAFVLLVQFGVPVAFRWALHLWNAYAPSGAHLPEPPAAHATAPACSEKPDSAAGIVLDKMGNLMIFGGAVLTIIGAHLSPSDARKVAAIEALVDDEAPTAKHLKTLASAIRMASVYATQGFSFILLGSAFILAKLFFVGD